VKISVIIPCYNNEGSLHELMDQMKQVQGNEIFKGHTFEYVLVDDGSKDNTYGKQQEIKKQYPEEVRVVKLSRNFGSYNSFLAGMCHATGDCNVYLHADLQDPPQLIPDMFEHYLKGNKLVIANRSARADGSLFSVIYHWMVKNFAIANIPPGGFDLILFDRQIKKDIIDISEKNTNNVYLIAWLGYPYVNIPYTRRERQHGKSQWVFWKKVKMFVDTFFSFSSIPINFIRAVFVLSLLILAAVILLIVVDVITEHALLYGALSFILALISFNFLVIGEFLVRIHETVRKRPNFVVDEVY
jgi:glycosyltransferase involved in cell wall biosynthesis